MQLLISSIEASKRINIKGGSMFVIIGRWVPDIVSG